MELERRVRQKFREGFLEEDLLVLAGNSVSTWVDQKGDDATGC